MFRLNVIFSEFYAYIVKRYTAIESLMNKSYPVLVQLYNIAAYCLYTRVLCACEKSFLVHARFFELFTISFILSFDKVT